MRHNSRKSDNKLRAQSLLDVPILLLNQSDIKRKTYKREELLLGHFNLC